MTDLIAGVVAGSIITLLIVREHFIRRVRSLEHSVALFRTMNEGYLRSLARWNVEAEGLAHNDAYRGLHRTVVEIEGRLGITPSKESTVAERWTKLSGSIDPHMLKLLLMPRNKRVNTAGSIRAAQRMLKLKAHVEATSGNEREAAQRALDRLIEKWGDQS